MAYLQASKFVKLLRQIFKELRIPKDGVSIYQDNKGIIDWTEGFPVNSFARHKHMDTHNHFFMYMGTDRSVPPQKIESEYMPTNFWQNR